MHLYEGQRWGQSAGRPGPKFELRGAAYRWASAIENISGIRMVLTVNESSWDDQGVEFSWCHKIRTVFLFVVKGRLFCSRVRISAMGGAPPGAVVAPE